MNSCTVCPLDHVISLAVLQPLWPGASDQCLVSPDQAPSDQNASEARCLCIGPVAEGASDPDQSAAPHLCPQEQQTECGQTPVVPETLGPAGPWRFSGNVPRWFWSLSSLPHCALGRLPGKEETLSRSDHAQHFVSKSPKLGSFLLKTRSLKMYYFVL